MNIIDKIVEMKQKGYKNVDVARMLDISETTVSRYTPKHLKREGNYKRNPKIDLTELEKQIIEGEILGDGRLSPPESESRFIHGGKEKEYTIHLRNKLKRLCEEGANKRYGASAKSITVYKGKKTTDYRFVTKTNPALTELWKKWYIKAPKYFKGKLYQKHIPDDFAMTPINLKYWYLGDGSITKKRKINYSQVIRLSSYDLPKSKLQSVIIPQLKRNIDIEKINIMEDKRKVRGDYGYYILIPARYVQQFLNYIGECPVDCYKYKWEFKKYVRKRWQEWEDDVLMKYWGRVPRNLIIDIFECGKNCNCHVYDIAKARGIDLQFYQNGMKKQKFDKSTISSFIDEVVYNRQKRHMRIENNLM